MGLSFGLGLPPAPKKGVGAFRGPLYNKGGTLLLKNKDGSLTLSGKAA